MSIPIQISVVLPVRNELERLPDLLHALTRQDFSSDAFEIIVVDGGSTDGTREAVTQFAATSRVKTMLVDNPGIRSSAGRNAGTTRARGEFIVFIDGHCSLPSINLLKDTVQLFRETGAHCLCRPQPLGVATSSTLGKVIATVRASSLGHGRDSLIYNLDFAGPADPVSSGASYRKSIFNVLVGYDESFDACEDVEFNTRVKKAGLMAYSDPRLTVCYAPRETLRAFVWQMVRYGKGRMRLALKHPDTVSVAQFAPLALIVVLTWATIMGGRSTWYGVLPLVLVICYSILTLQGALQLTRKNGLQYLFKAPVIYLAIHLGLGAGMLLEGLSSVFRSLSGFRRRSSQSG